MGREEGRLVHFLFYYLSTQEKRLSRLLGEREREQTKETRSYLQMRQSEMRSFEICLAEFGSEWRKYTEAILEVYYHYTPRPPCLLPGRFASKGRFSSLPWKPVANDFKGCWHLGFVINCCYLSYCLSLSHTLTLSLSPRFVVTSSLTVQHPSNTYHTHSLTQSLCADREEEEEKRQQKSNS